MPVTPFTIDSTAEEVTSALASQISGKNVLINGVTAKSLGAEAARLIAKHANLVILGGRDKTKLQATIDWIKEDSPNANLRSFTFDMMSFDGARKAAEEVNAMPEPIHVVILSAAVMAVPWSKSADGIEHHMAVNHFAHFHFINLIFPKLVASGTSQVPARIVSVSSWGHNYCGVLEDINFADGKEYDKWKGYGQSKTANILFANEIARRTKEKGVNVVAFSMHPGLIGFTNLNQHLTKEDFEAIEKMGAVRKSKSQGVAGYIVAAFEPSLVPHSGAYITDSDVDEAGKAEHARGQANGERLWKMSENLSGAKFVI